MTQQIILSRIQKLIPLNQLDSEYFETHFQVRAQNQSALFQGAVVSQQELDEHEGNLPFQTSEGGTLVGSVREDSGQPILWYLVLQSLNGEIPVEVQITSAPIAAADSALRPKTKNMLKWLIIALILIAVAIGVYFLVKKYRSSSVAVPAVESINTEIENFTAVPEIPVESCQEECKGVNEATESFMAKINELPPL